MELILAITTTKTKHTSPSNNENEPNNERPNDEKPNDVLQSAQSSGSTLAKLTFFSSGKTIEYNSRIFSRKKSFHIVPKRYYRLINISFSCNFGLSHGYVELDQKSIKNTIDIKIRWNKNEKQPRLIPSKYVPMRSIYSIP